MYKSIHVQKLSNNAPCSKLNFQNNVSKHTGNLQRRNFALNSRSLANARTTIITNNKLLTQICNIAKSFSNETFGFGSCRTHLQHVIHKDAVRMYSSNNTFSFKITGKSVHKLELKNHRTTIFLRRAWALNLRNPTPKQLLYYFTPTGHESVVSQTPKWLPTRYYLPPRGLTNAEAFIYLLLLLIALITFGFFKNLDFEKLEQDKTKLEKLYKLLIFSQTYTVPPVNEVLKIPVQMFLLTANMFGSLINVNAGNYAVYKGVIDSLHNILNSGQEPATITMALECLSMLSDHGVRKRITELGTVPIILDSLKANGDPSDGVRIRLLAKMTNEPSIRGTIGLHPKFMRALRQQAFLSSVTVQAKIESRVMLDISTKYKPFKLVSAQLLANLTEEAYENPDMYKMLTEVDNVVFIDNAIDSPNEDTHWYYREAVLKLQELMEEKGKDFSTVFHKHALQAVQEEEDAPSIYYNAIAAFFGVVLWSGMRSAWTLAFKPQYKVLNLTTKQRFQLAMKCIRDSLIISVGLFNLPKLFTVHQNFALPNIHFKFPEWLDEVPVAGRILRGLYWLLPSKWDELRTSHLITFGGLGWAYWAMFSKFRGYWLFPCLMFQFKCVHDQHREEFGNLGLKLGIIIRDDDDDNDEGEEEKPKTK